LHYLTFFSWLALWGWIFSDLCCRFGIKKLGAVHSALDELASGIYCGVRWGRALALGLEVLFALVLAYILMIWAVWCVLMSVRYTIGQQESQWVYFVTGFICCVLPLGKVARAMPSRGFWGSVFPFTMGMGAFIVFSLNDQPIRDAFPWMLYFVGLRL
jgi:hypothetical protein